MEMLRGAAPAPSPLAQELANLPNFDSIRALILQNPEAMLPMAMQQLQASNPAMHTLIQQNPEEFMRYLTQGLPGGPGGAPGGHGGPGGPGRVVTLGPADMEPINRLMGLGGFTQEQAARAYVMANRNEEVAAAILFEAMEGGGEGEGPEEEE
jgi:hypothetical protein